MAPLWLDSLVNPPPGLDLLLRITVLLALAWVIHAALGRFNPRWRALLWRGTALALLLLPALELALPRIHAPIIPMLSGPTPANTIIEKSRESGTPVHSTSLPSMPVQNPYPPEYQSNMSAPPQSVNVIAQGAIGRDPWNTRGKGSWPGLILAVWGLGVLALAGWLALRARRFRRLVNNAKPAPEEFRRVLMQTAAALGCPIQVSLYSSTRIASPVMTGLVRPRIILPERLLAPEHLSDLPAILAHELVHVRTRDLLWSHLLQVPAILLWFHPLAWGMRMAHSAACEKACDAAAADYFGNVESYSAVLARVALALVAAHRRLALGGLPMARKPEIRLRLELLRRKIYAHPLRRRWIALSAAAGLPALILIAGLHLAYAKKNADEKPQKGAESADMNIRAESADMNTRATSPMSPTGRVLDEQGRPVGQAKMVLYYHVSRSSRNGFDNQVIEELQSGTDGSFAFKKSIPFKEEFGHSYAQDWYVLVAVHPDHALAWHNIRQGQEKTSYTLTMTAPKSITMTVTDMDGKPLAGARVWPYGIGSRESPNTLLRDYLDLPTDIGIIGATTDSSGKAVVNNLPQTSCSFNVSLKGYATGLAFGGPGRIRLVKGANVSGAVRDSQGKPVAGAVVLLGADWMIKSFAARTDAQGHYLIEDVAPKGWDMGPWGGDEQATGGYRASVQSESGAAEGLPIHLRPGEEVKDFDFLLEPGTLIKCQVVEVGTDKPVAGARIGGENAGKSINGYTDAGGLFKFRAMPGQVSLSYSSPPDGVYMDDSVKRKAASVPRLDFEAKGSEMNVTMEAPPVGGRLVLVRGKVLGPDGSARPGVSVAASAGQFRTSTKIGYVPTVTTDSNGAFEFPEVPEGKKLSVYAEMPDRSLAGAVWLDIPRDAGKIPETTVWLDLTTTGSTLIRDLEGNPRKQFRVAIRPIVSGEAILFLDISATTDEQGILKVNGIIKGLMYELVDADFIRTGRNRREILESKVQLAPGPILFPEDKPPLVAKPKIHNNKLQGRVVDEKGTPIVGALIRPEPYSDLWLREQREDNKTSSTSDQKGDFAFSRLASGELSLLISAKGYKSLETLAPTDSANFRAVLRPASELDRYSVTVVDQEGKPIDNAPVTIWQNIVQGGQRTTAIRTAKTSTTGKADIELPFNGARPGGNLSFVYCDMEGRNLAFYPARHSGDAQITLMASPGGSHWHGKVVDPSEKPIEGAMVRVVSLQPWKAGFRGNVYFSECGAEGNANLNLTSTTDRTGRFEIPRISTNDSVNVFVWAPGYVMRRVYMYPSDPEYKDGKVIALGPAGTVEGRLVIKGTDKLFPGSDKVSITFVSKTTRDSVPLIEPPRDGAFRADYLARGTYTAKVEITDPAWSKYTCATPPTFDIVIGKTTKVSIELEEGPAQGGPVNDGEKRMKQ